MDIFKYTEEMFDELYGRLSIPVILFDKKARLIKANQSFLNLAKASLDKILDEKVRLEKDLVKTKAFLENLLESCGDVSEFVFPPGD